MEASMMITFASLSSLILLAVLLNTLDENVVLWYQCALHYLNTFELANRLISLQAQN
jgi:hypothetical protein